MGGCKWVGQLSKFNHISLMKYLGVLLSSNIAEIQSKLDRR